jgi:hypothetical protein
MLHLGEIIMNTIRIRRQIIGAALALSTFPVLASPFDWFGKSVEGSGKIVKQERSAKDFRGVVIAVSAKVEVKQGDREGITIETDDNIQAALEVVVEGSTLKIRPREKNTSLKTRTFNIVINLKNLDDLALEGSGSVNSDKLVAPDLKLRLGGSGDINVNELKGDTLKVTIGGSGSFSAKGNVQQIAGAIGGSGEMDIAKLMAKDVRISIGGSGSVQTWATDNLSVDIGGSGSVAYYGDPRVSKSIGGSGKVTRKGATP